MHPPDDEHRLSQPGPLGDKARGFTLLELLAVMAVAAVLAGVAVPALSGLSGSGSLTGAGLQVEALFETARQKAIAKRVPTAVAILKSAASEGAYRTMATFELVRGTGGSPGQWSQLTPWQTLPKGVVIADGASSSNFLSQSPTLSPAMSEIRYRDAVYQPGTDFSYQIFLPSGRLKSPPSPCNLTLVRGYYEGSALKQTDQGANYYSLFIVDATGETKITRP